VTQCPYLIHPSHYGGVTGRPETMCPRTHVLGPLVPKLIVPSDTLSLDLYIPDIMHYTICLGWCKITVMYQCRDIVFLGRFILGTRSPRKFLRGHILSGRPVDPHAESVLYLRGAAQW